MIIFTHPDCLLKENGSSHPEKKERLAVVLKAIQDMDDVDTEVRLAPLATHEQISLVHPESYLRDLFAMIPDSGLVTVEEEPNADTFLCPNSKDAILRACGAGIAAVQSVMQDGIKRVFCAVRPPGHHAETTRANGFCFVNNVAVAARYLQDKHQIKRIAIIDFDVHHGNGTQEIFYNDSSVLYGSIHEHPLFPGTGSEEEVGAGNIFNAPIATNTNGSVFFNIFKDKILDNVDKFQPEIILLSAGFDAHRRDPLAHIDLESKDYFRITKDIVNIANRYAQGRVISFLEGGYDLVALSESVTEHLRGLKEPKACN
ncbi:MAG: acetoin utilization deacetylase AcuC-like enzyme [Myxococcota bacterium]|jgi:acetoin utilization deacetylase AcuC-like enzyme